MIYLDAAAAAPPDEEVLQFFLQCERENFANQEALHHLAYEARNALQKAGETLSAALTGTPDYPVIWGNSATELFALLGAYLAGKKVVTSVLEHPALRAAVRNNCIFEEIGCTPQGILKPLPSSFVPDALWFHQVQSELGVMQEPEICFSSSSNALKILDAVQAAGKLPLFSRADVIVISGVKFGAPGGAALLIHPRSPQREKLLDFAESYRHEAYRISRPSLPMARALAFAAEKRAAQREELLARISAVRRIVLEETAKFGIPPTIPPELASPYILHLMLPGRQAAVIVRALSERGIHTASGSACAAESTAPSPALLALGYRPAEAYSGLRISFHASSTCEEGKIFAAELKNVLKNY